VQGAYRECAVGIQSNRPTFSVLILSQYLLMSQMKYQIKVLVHIQLWNVLIIITTAGIASLLQNLDVHKASVLNEISTRFLKETTEVTAPVLKLIFERSLDTDDVPCDWRVANVVPIYMKGERSAPQNYHPILLKVLDHIISF